MPSIAGFFSRMRIWKFSGGPWAGCGVPFVLPESTLRQAVGALLDANRYPHGSSRITLRVFPHGLESDAEEPSWLLETAAPLYYPRYVLWHKRPLLDVFPCDCAWPGYPTSVSLLSAAFGRDAAARAGAELAVLENRRDADPRRRRAVVPRLRRRGVYDAAGSRGDRFGDAAAGACRLPRRKDCGANAR